MNDITPKSYIQSLEDRIRADNLNRYIEETFDGNRTAFAKSIGIEKPHEINNLGYALRGLRAFGNNLATKIELGLSFPAGTLSKINCKFPSKAPEVVEIQVYNNEAAAGPGSHLFDDDFLIEPTHLSLKFILDQGLDPSSLVGIRAHGKSMQPVIMDGAIVILDISEKARSKIDSGAAYCFKTNNSKRQLKYLIEGVNGIIVKSANPDFESEVIPYDTENEIIIDGRVATVINPFGKI